MKIKKLITQYRDYIVDLRRDFHMYPETSWNEKKTSQRIQEELDQLGIPYQVVAETGVVATIKGQNNERVVALRADIDALEIDEATDISYKSKYEGVMHACGHDGHTAMLLGAARALNEVKEDLTGTVKLFFQPAEEVVQGAEKLLETGAMDDVDNVFGIHLWADLDCGSISVEAGPRMASADLFEITVTGKGGHGSLPHQGVDATVVASAIVMDLQSIVSREITPLESAVVSVGKLTSGTRFNVLSNKAVLEGTTRAFNKEIRKEFPEIIERIAQSTAASYRAQAEVDYTYGTPPVINDPAAAELAGEVVIEILDQDALVEMEKVTGGEDFAKYLAHAPGVLAFVGAKPEDAYPHHHQRFNINEEALEIGATLYAQYALNFLQSN
ncbi:M20 family metallopeptidase [Natroniella acetigena]|uniref:M20 family metallopeptidase n=1 Tax=Natroniella acetigena TaxID=52004 RepID=UPI00200AB38B|nr:M20 family metallopeptidase [Natroniella acetigena]MCK8828007.1 M20 family metallopeptidase [Natroniella acetigena]